MYATRTTQLIVGIFAILGMIALAILSLSLGKLTLLPKAGYTLYASFDNISGLKPGDQIQLDGVQIGKVVQIGLKDMRARVAMRIDDGVEIDADAIAAVKTSGIIGDKYMSIALGPSDRILKDGDTIRQTQSAFVLEDAIGQLINNSGSGGDSAKDKSSNSDKGQKPGKSEK
ncbi:outer membrane lipid asymmetry maintenance protein MlaD [Candidatus Binatus sp.]|uniref:outer membrane lipid asymmetry maintenance protein MlaD n=1 Tax=Candidatus Binatus sp. TaxID=2811406 RepID=UPI002F934E67